MTWTQPFAADSFPSGSDAFPHKHLLGIASLQKWEILYILKEAQQWVVLNRSGAAKHDDRLSGLTIINAFFENSTRTLLSFEIAGKRLGADVVNMHAAQSSVKKGETLIDTAMTLNAMRADAIVIRHGSSGAVQLISSKVDCPILNAGDGSHEHPTQALLDALTIMRRKGKIEGQTVVICGDVLHSRVARSNLFCLKSLGAEVRVVAPPALMPSGIEAFGAIPFSNFDAALNGADVIMMLRLQSERMQGDFIPSPREYFYLYGLDERRLALAKPDALVMHPGPMNRGVEIASSVADHVERSAIIEQVEMGVAVRMACLDILTRKARGQEGWA
jgi:aspartate carbamoyltransferase catalytic subunit